MRELFPNLLYWHWVGVASVTLIIEVLTGTGFLLWVGISAVIVAAIVFFMPDLIIGIQILLFALFSLISGFAWKLYLHYHPIKTDKPDLNRRGEQYIGRVFTLQHAIINGMGTIHVDDTIWRVHCAKDLLAHSRIKITGVDGVILFAEPYQD